MIRTEITDFKSIKLASVQINRYALLLQRRKLKFVFFFTFSASEETNTCHVALDLWCEMESASQITEEGYYPL